MNKSMLLVVVFALLLASCAPAAATEAPAAANPGLQMDSATVAAQFFNDADYAASLEQMKMAPLNPSDPIYLQYLIDNPTDISKYPQYADFAAKEAPYNICFSNAGVNNPWRVVGYTTCASRLRNSVREGLIRNFIHVDATGPMMPSRSLISRT